MGFVKMRLRHSNHPCLSSPPLPPDFAKSGGNPAVVLVHYRAWQHFAAIRTDFVESDVDKRFEDICQSFMKFVDDNKLFKS